MAKNNNEPVHFSTFIYRFRLIIFIIAFLVIIPALFVTLLYATTYSNSKKTIYFDTETQEVIKKFHNPNDLPINLFYTVIGAKPTVFLSNGNVSEDGNYELNVSYNNKSGVTDIERIDLVFMVHAKWINFREISSRTLYNTNLDSKITITHQQKFPSSPLWFVNVKYPDLYISVKVLYKNSKATETFYLRDSNSIKNFVNNHN